MEKIGIGIVSDYLKPAAELDINMLKRLKNLELPSAAATMQYSTAIKTEAIMRFGFYNFLKGIKKLIRQPVKDETENAISALTDAIKRMKKETLEGLVFHFKNYKENLKFQYIFKLIDTVSDNIYEVMMERFHDYTQDLSQLTSSAVKEQVDKDQLSQDFDGVASDVKAISDRMDTFHNALVTGN